MFSTRMLRGTGVALVTPFLKSGSIDFRALQKLTEYVTRGRVEYLVVAGTTGESVTLSHDEKLAVLQCVVEVNDERLPVVFGVGGNNTADILNDLDRKELQGVDAILSVAPYYNRPNQKGLYEHFKSIAMASPYPVIIYNVPSRTSVNIAAETQLNLAKDFKNIIATKEASGIFDQVMSIIQNKPEEFLVISGDDILTLPLIACGAGGVISVAANAYPQRVSNMVRFALKNKFAGARKLHYELLEITRLMFAEGNPAGIKNMLQVMEICNDYVRLPLVSVSTELRKKIKTAIL